MTTPATTATTAAPINIRADLLSKIGGIAAQQHKQVDTFINAILEQYLSHTPQQPSPDATFLLSIAGMFDSGSTTASEQVNEIVGDAVAKKYAR